MLSDAQCTAVIAWCWSTLVTDVHAFAATAAAIALFILFLRAARHRDAFFEQYIAYLRWMPDLAISSYELGNFGSLGCLPIQFHCYLGHIYIAQTARVQSNWPWHSMEIDT